MKVSFSIRATAEDKYSAQALTTIDLTFIDVVDDVSMEDLARLVIDWFGKQPRIAKPDEKK